MGNILSQDDQGSLKKSGETINPFTQNMTNLLFELDLFNTGKFATQATANDKSGPRAEFDFTEKGVSKDPASRDVANYGRPVNAKSEFIDINGWTYTDNSAIAQIDTISPNTSVTNLPLNAIGNNSNKLYNLKRAFCNASPDVPVNMVGVDLPNIDYQADQTKLGIPNEEVINNCLLYGTPTAGTLPTNADEKLNFSSNYKLNDFSTNTVYDTPMNEYCKNTLNTMLINSYVAPKLADYSNWADKESLANATSGNVATLSLLHNPVTNAIAVQKTDKETTPLKEDGKTVDPNFTRFGMTTGRVGNSSASTTVKLDQNSQCADFSIDVCNYFYYYDVKDGILFNPNFNEKNADPSNYGPNMRYLNQQIPECRCLSFENLGGKDNNGSNGLLTFYKSNMKCDTNINYGKSIGKIDQDISLFNQNSASMTPDAIGFRRQKDPSLAISTDNDSEKKFLYASDYNKSAILRNDVSINNSYTCNMAMNIKISDVAGNTLVGGNTMECNFPGSTKVSGGDKNTANAVSTITVTSLSNQQGPLEIDSLPLNARDIFRVGVSYPSTDTTTVQNFFNLVSIAFYPVNGGDPILLPKASVKCTNPSSNNGSNVCNPPYIVNAPFIYGSEMNLTGVKYLVKLTKNPSSTSQFLTTNGLPINLIQYSMRISSINLQKISGINMLMIGINLNTLPGVIFDLPCRVLLTPVIGNSPPNKCKSATGTTTSVAANNSSSTISDAAPICTPVQIIATYPNLFTALSTNPYLVIGSNTQRICPVKYYYSIKLNEINDGMSYTGGYDMLYDPQMPLSQQCVVDFSNLISSFNQFKLMYYDYDNNNSINIVANNDNVKVGSTMKLEWVYNSVDSTETVIDIYYDTVSTYDVNSSSKVLLTSGYTNGYPLSQSGTGLLTNSYTFVYPILTAQSPVIFYAVVRGTLVVSPIIKTMNSNLPVNFRNWNIVSGKITDLSTTPLVPTNNIPSVDNYFSIANSTPSYKYVVFNYISGKWFGGNTLSATPVSTDSIIFQNPVSYPVALPKITITSIADLKTGTTITIPLPSTNPIMTLELGANIIVSYTITPSVTYDTTMQVVLAGKVVSSFIVKATSNGTTGSSSGQVTIPIFADLNVTSPTLFITSYNTTISLPNNKYTSSPVQVQISNNSASLLQITNITSPITVNINNSTNPVLNIRPATPISIIDTINISYNPFTSNNFYTSFDGCKRVLSIKKAIIKYGAIDFTLPFSYTFAVAKPSSSFTNVDNKFQIRKNIENFSSTNSIGELYIDLLQFDFSSAVLTPQININLLFARYNKVYIQNLELIYGDSSLDGKKFGIQLDGYSDPTVSIPTKIEISKITFIGKLTSNIFLSKPISDNSSEVLVDVYYSTNNKINGNYALLVPLIYSNGYYSVPETYTANLSSVVNSSNNIAAKPLVVNSQPAPAPAPEDNSWSTSSIILVIFVFALIAGIAYVYLTYFATSAPTDISAPTSDSPAPTDSPAPDSPAPTDSPVSTDSPAPTDSPAQDSPTPDSPASDKS